MSDSHPTRSLEFPDEVWLLVFSCFQPRSKIPSSSSRWTRQVGTLCNICRVSTRFRALAQPLLYHTISVERFPAWALLIRQLSQQAVLSERVKELHLPFLYGRSSWPEDIISNAFAAARPRLQLSDGTEHRLVDFLTEERSDEHSDPITAFFMALTPNVEILSFGVPDQPSLISAVFRSAIHSLSNTQPDSNPSMSANRFAFLKEIRVKPSEAPADMVVMGKITEIFSLPALKTLRGYRTIWVHEDGLRDFAMPDIV